MTRKEAEDEMMQGFMDGYDRDAPEPSENRSHSYRHGFANGLRDRGILNDGATADWLRSRAESCITADMHGATS
jgi:hypothetical protein